MKTGLAGSGVKDAWHVEIDELIDLGLYGISIANLQFHLVISEAPVDRIRKLLRFLQASKQDEFFEFRDAFGGKVGFRNHDGAIFIRIWHEGEHGPNLLEIPVEYAECVKLASALEEALCEASLLE